MRKRGARVTSVAVMCLVVALVFWILGDTAERYFCPVVRTLADRWNLAPATAGVTLLALGNGAPDVFASLAAFTRGDDVFDDGETADGTTSATAGATAATGDSYQGGRDYDTLSKWAKDNLGPTCGAENIDLCTDDQKAVIKEKQALSDADLDAEIAVAEGEIKQADTDLEELLKSLQAQYEAGKKKKDETIAEKSPALALLRSVKRAKTGGAKTEL